MSKEKISARELEQQILDKDEIRVVIRAPKDEKFDKYEFSRRASGNSSVNDWKENRIKPLIGDREVEIIDGNGGTPHGKTKIEKIRNSYVEK